MIGILLLSVSTINIIFIITNAVVKKLCLWASRLVTRKGRETEYQK